MTTTTTQSSAALARAEALAYVERAECARLLIDDEHRRAIPDRSLIAKAHGELGLCLKLAEVHATLAVAEAIEAGQ